MNHRCNFISIRLKLACIFLLSVASVFSVANSAAPTRIGDATVTGTLTAGTGATVDFSLATVSLPADVSRLGSTISLTSEVTGILPIANGGTGAASPALVAGANIALTGTFPAQTIALSGVIPVANGGTGTATPGIVAGSNITVTGTWPNQTVASTGGGGVSFVTAPIYSNDAGTAGQLAYDSSYIYICVSTNLWKQIALSTFAASSTATLTYSSDGDTNGVFYYLGTSYATVSWTNPYTAGTLPIGGTAPNTGGDLKASIVDRAASNYSTGNDGTKNVRFDLGLGRSLVPNKFSYRYRDDTTTYAPTGWTFEASNDDSTWTTLTTVTGQTPTINGWVSTTVSGVSTGYRYFRLKMTGTNNSGTNQFSIGEAELYGTFSY